MENVVPFKIQIISIIGTLFFMAYVFKQILNGKLREEYSIIWIIFTFILVVISIWRDSLRWLAINMGVFYAPSLLFMISIGAIIIFLLHLSLVVSKQHNQIKSITQELALLKQELEENIKKNEHIKEIK